DTSSDPAGGAGLVIHRRAAGIHCSRLRFRYRSSVPPATDSPGLESRRRRLPADRRRRRPAAPPPRSTQPAPHPPRLRPPAAAADVVEPTPSTYVLKPGDNLTHVARAFGTSVDAILAANGLTNANRIYAGKALTIPGSDTADEVADDAPQTDKAQDAQLDSAEIGDAQAAESDE